MTASWNHQSGASPSHYPSGDDSPDSTASQIRLLPTREYAASRKANATELQIKKQKKSAHTTVHGRRKVSSQYCAYAILGDFCAAYAQ